MRLLHFALPSSETRFRSHVLPVLPHSCLVSALTSPLHSEPESVGTVPLTCRCTGAYCLGRIAGLPLGVVISGALSRFVACVTIAVTLAL